MNQTGLLYRAGSWTHSEVGPSFYEQYSAKEVLVVKQTQNRSSVVGSQARRRRLRGAALLVALLLLAVPLVPPVNAGGDTFPSVFNIPDGWQPEGIAVGRGSSFYVGSLLTGAVYGGDLRTGEGEIVVPPQTNRVATGLTVDLRSNAIFVAGGGPALGPTISGSAYVYDAETGAELAEYSLGGLFINDVVVTRDAAYFTDSGSKVLYRIPLGPRGELPEPSAVQEIVLGDGFDFDPAAFPNANGIVATPDGKSLIVVNTAFGGLYKVDPLSGEATQIDLGGASVPNGDGLVLDGETLYVVQNFSNQIGVVMLDPSLTSGVVSDEPLTSADFIVPTTAAKFGSMIYAVNARFGEFTFGVPSPDLEFQVVGLPIP
jgi:sugar lactone lactonase YvrE